MGSLFSQIQRPINVAAGSVTEIITGRKRKREDEEYDSSDEISSAAEQSLNTPKRFVCFKFIRNDVTVKILVFFLKQKETTYNRTIHLQSSI